MSRGLKYMCQIVRNRAYTTGTRYYYHPDWFFFYLSDLCANNASCSELAELRRLLTARLRERMGGCAGWRDAFSAAMRVVAAHNLGIENRCDWDILVGSQQSDGSWSKDAWVYRFGSSGILFGSSGLVTAMVLKALGDAPQYFVEASGLEIT